MQRLHVLAALLLLDLAPMASALDFQLRELRVNDLDEVKVDFYFEHESNRVFYRPPPHWTWEGSSARFEASTTAPRSGRLTIISMKPIAELGMPGDEEQKEAFQKLALATLPPEARGMQVLGVTVSRLGGRELPCTSVTIAYQHLQERVATISFAAFRPHLWLKFTIDAIKADFPRASTEVIQSLEGFTEVPGEATP